MQVAGVSTLAHYRDHLKTHAEETPALLQDMLISVTSFFRDRPAFASLERDVVLPALVARVGPRRPLRAWVVSCTSGEEVYSVAMLLQEAVTYARPGGRPFQVFATDIDDPALTRARAGLYPGSIVTDVPPTRLRTWFVPQHDHLRVAKAMRDRLPVRPLPNGSDRGPEPAWGDLHQRARGDHAPPSVLIDSTGRILHVSEGMAGFLQPAGGMPSQRLSCMH